jgi:Protein of unknown function (DUF559)
VAPSRVDPEQAVEYGLFSREQALLAGYTAREVARRLRCGQWQRWAQGLYQDVGRVEHSHDDILKATLLGGPRAVASHLSAAKAHGWDLLDPPARPHVTVPRTHGSVKIPGGRALRRALSQAEVTAVGVLPVTTPLRTALDVAAEVELTAAVVAVDSALRQGQVSVGELTAELQRRNFMPGHRSAATAIGLVDPSSGSVPESVARVLFGAAGLPMPISQFDVVCDGRWIARVDFAWPGLRLVVEIDGYRWHSGRTAFQDDRSRQNELELARWTVLRFTADDVRHRPQTLVRTVSRGLMKS